jgi:hypothetical protein
MHQTSFPTEKKAASRFKFCHRAGDFSRGIKRKTGTNSKNNVCTIRVAGSFQTKRFADNPLDSVSLYSPFQLTMNTDSNSIKFQFVGTEYQGKPFIMPTCPLPVYLIKLPTLAEKGSFREFTLRQCI